MGSHEHRGRATARYLPWADVAKGLCIILVVLHHEVSKDLAYLGLTGSPWLLDAWREIDAALINVRMPVFFLISGLLAAPALRRPWRALLGPRLANPYYLFVLWSTLQGAFFLVGPRLRTDPLDGTHEFLANLLLPSTTLWYLFALPVYFALARLLVGRAPAWLIVVAGTAAFAVVRSDLLPVVLPGHADNVDRVLAYPGFFLLGALAPSQLTRLAETTSRRRLGWLAAGFVVTSLAIAALHLRGVIGVPLVASALAIALGLGGSAQLVRSAPRLAPAVGALGRRTLPIYVLHLPVLAVVHAAGRALGVTGSAAATAVLLLWPLVATATVIALSLGLHRALLAAGARLLFTVPDPLLRPWTLARRAPLQVDRTLERYPRTESTTTSSQPGAARRSAGSGGMPSAQSTRS